MDAVSSTGSGSVLGGGTTFNQPPHPSMVRGDPGKAILGKCPGAEVACLDVFLISSH